MSKIRIIPRLDIKNENLIKGIHLEGLRVIGNPNQFAKNYFENGADEILYIDLVASLYRRSKLTSILRETVNDVFIPITVGGGIRNVSDVMDLLNSGADKVAINTAAVNNPKLIKHVSRTFGSQCMVLSVEAKKTESNKWEVYTDCGRERTGLDVIDWVKYAEELGAGEILLTSIDQEGTQKGFDIDLISKVNQSVSIPVIASGGFGNFNDLKNLLENSKVSGCAIAHSLHYKKTSINKIKEECVKNKFEIRLDE